MAVSPMQIVVSSCVVFFSYFTERVPATLRYSWINFSSLSLLVLLWLSLLHLVSLELSFSLAFSNSLCLPLSICLSILFPEPFLLLAQLIALPIQHFLTHPLSGPVNCTLTVSLLPHIFVYTHTDERQSQRETRRSLSCLREREEKWSIRSHDQGVPMSERENSEQERQETHVAMTKPQRHYHHQCLKPGRLPPPLGGHMCHLTHAHSLLSPTPHTNGYLKTCSFIHQLTCTCSLPRLQ